MKIFVTGATGFLGLAIVKELVSAGHQVTGLARSEASEKKLIEAGAQALRGDIEDLDVLRNGASFADAAIHTAFYHEISHLPLRTRLGVFLGGLPTGIVNRFLNAALEADRRALQTIGDVFTNSDRKLLGTFGTIGLKNGALATEQQSFDQNSPGAARGATENIMLKLASDGVCTSIVRLPPVVHGEGDRNGFIPFLIKTATKKGESAYIDNGGNRWGAVHKDDAANLFRLVLEGTGPSGSAYHAVAEEGIEFKKIAEALAAGLHIPAVSKKYTEAAKQFSFLAPFIPADNPVSSQLTQQRTGWKPTHDSLFIDLQRSGYFRARS